MIDECENYLKRALAALDKICDKCIYKVKDYCSAKDCDIERARIFIQKALKSIGK